ncbi:MAG TPA: THUMP domain-containing protein [Polyangia bacterium]
MRFFVTCARGTEGPLRRELVNLRIRGPRGAEGGVSFEGRLSEALAVCLHSRVAMRVLLEIGDGPLITESADALYEGVRALPWADHLNAKATLAVSATVRDNPALAHSGFAALKVKDAVVDALRDRFGTRPNVDVRDPDVPIVLHVRGLEARLFLDLSGEPLHRRGYRVAMTEAPLKENLAAAILSLCDADPERPFFDPMAGSGTFAIEQALRARKLAPGLNRRFAFERWPDQTPAGDWARLQEAARAMALPQAPAPIFARDISPAAVEATKRNASAARVLADLRCEVGTLTSASPPAATGTLLTNPPYGQRLIGDDDAPAPTAERARPGALYARPSGPARPARGPRAAPDESSADLAVIYRELAAALQRFEAWNLAVFSGNPLFSRIFLRKADISHRLWNGPLETRLLVFRPR